MESSKKTRMRRMSRMSGGHGTGEGNVGLVERSDTEEGPLCEARVEGSLCSRPAVLYFVETAEETMTYACLEHAGTIAYDVAVTSTADPDVPAWERGADDRRWKEADG
ncbi:hypothetical protein ABZY93_22330 [Streptomyces smyrnaeus]|uniref:hypothetical protein n=1 Tax=Streptomyces smyrnaeus TaxID=1387713 RepID=UPI0033A11FF7